ncbi:MAG: hypothetical protein U5M51_09370 [Emticicia sp.]|nr:hypothetical protein [Emticicia sp.]
MDYDIFMAEAENVGYKRTKRGENPMPNDLYDIEYAPTNLDTKEHCQSITKKKFKHLNKDKQVNPNGIEQQWKQRIC